MSVNYGSRDADLHGAWNIPDELCGLILDYADIHTINRLYISVQDGDRLVPFQNIRRLVYENGGLPVLLNWPLLGRFTKIRELKPPHVNMRPMFADPSRYELLAKCLDDGPNVHVHIGYEIFEELVDATGAYNDHVHVYTRAFLKKASLVHVASSDFRLRDESHRPTSDITIDELIPNLDKSQSSITMRCYRIECGNPAYCLSARHGKLARSIIDSNVGEIYCRVIAPTHDIINPTRNARVSFYRKNLFELGAKLADSIAQKHAYVGGVFTPDVELLIESGSISDMAELWAGAFDRFKYSLEDPFHGSSGVSLKLIGTKCERVMRGTCSSDPADREIAEQTWTQMLKCALHCGSGMFSSLLHSYGQPYESILEFQAKLFAVLQEVGQYNSKSLLKSALDILKLCRSCVIGTICITEGEKALLLAGIAAFEQQIKAPYLDLVM
tara:strand:- start:1059 stop:2384 length:1326 start_codon:yes stop_codon:yes gene_type:complete